MLASSADGPATDHTETWHYGLIARWWAEFNRAGPEEIEYYRSAIHRFGEPALDLGCGTGRLLVPLAAEGVDVDGVDVSADMVAAARAAVGGTQQPRLFVQALHELSLERTYGTAYMCGVLGIGGRRDRDREALRRIYELLEPGGALVISHWLPYGETDAAGWSDWLPGHRARYPQSWPEKGNRKRSADGDEIELITRIESFDPLDQQLALAMKARLWRSERIVKEERYVLKSCLYFAQEILLMLADVGFRDLVVQGGFRGEPATGDDGIVTFVAER